MAKRGRKTVDQTSWLRAGGDLPAKPAGLNAQEARYYKWLHEAMTLVGVGGRVDQLLLMMTARQLARADELRDAMVDLHPGDPIRKSISGDLDRVEGRIQTALVYLHLTPRTRAGTRLPAEAKGSLPGGEDNPILRLLDGSA